MFPFPVSLVKFFHEVSSMGSGQDEIQSEQVSLQSKPIKPSCSPGRDKCSPSHLFWPDIWWTPPLCSSKFIRYHIVIERSELSGYFCGLLFVHLAELWKFVLGHVCLPTPGHRGDPITPLTEMPALACGDFRSGHAWRVATLPVLPFSNLSPLWLERDGREWAAGGGHLLAGACNVFRSTEFWQHRSMRFRKMPAANESQQCLSNWTTTQKALCNWDTVNISKLSLNKLSVFIFSTLYQIFLKQLVIEGSALNLD